MKSTPFSKPWYNPSMKAKTILLILSLILLFAFVSCKTVEVVQEPAEVIDLQPEAEEERQPQLPEEEPAEAEEQQEIPVEPAEEPQSQETLAWQIGEAGPYGNPVFECEGRYLEISQPMYEAESYDSALEYCAELSSDEASYRLPTIAELISIYTQLLESELVELDYTYYWSSEENEDGTVKIMNFDTGFEGSFFRDMDFVSVIAVTQL